ncbi:MAG: hypothetical protein ABEH86_08780 [Haloarcula sp.]
MSTRTVERVDGWKSVPFEGGYAGLQKLAGQEFSGAVITGPTRLFMLNGTVVGVLDGTVTDFEASEGTAKESPHEALPLLAVMQERADEVKGQYYTEDTPLSEVDGTLSDGSFTGFIELSENVLSGDYYTVYHQGRSMSVGWVGSAEKLLTDDEAFETANDEVGIYEVKQVDIEPVEIPEPAERTTSEAADEAVAGVADTDRDETEPGSDEEGSTARVESQPSSDRDSGVGGPPGSKAAGANLGAKRRNPDADENRAAGETEQDDVTETVRDPDEEVSEQSTAERTAGTRTESTQAEPEAEPSSPSHEASTRASPTASDQPTGDKSEPAEQTGNRGQHPSPRTEQSDEAAVSEPTAGSGSPSSALETRSIPSLDPDRSVSGQTGASVHPTQSSTPSQSASEPRRDQPEKDVSDTATADAGEIESPAASGTPEQPTEHASAPEQSDTRAQPAPADQSQTESSSETATRAAELESKLEQRTETVSELEANLTELQETNETLRAERDRLESELADARAEIDRLEEQLAEHVDDTASDGIQLSADEAINGTNLFVRYHSKGKATLEKARDGEANREQVEENLRIEYHTQFEAAGATVDNTPFEEFLEESIQYRFVTWLIRNLLYEIRDTDHASAMRDLYDGLPEIDRAELNGSVTVTYTEDGKKNRSQERFDVVVRDRMGNPLVVANINDSREPATEEQMSDLVRNAERVGNASDAFASAFLVTSSFFQPGALETAKEATSSGLFNRDKRKSFVNLSRKEGFHLCLLEARNQEFHLAVPEL